MPLLCCTLLQFSSNCFLDFIVSTLKIYIQNFRFNNFHFLTLGNRIVDTFTPPITYIKIEKTKLLRISPGVNQIVQHHVKGYILGNEKD